MQMLQGWGTFALLSLGWGILAQTSSTFVQAAAPLYSIDTSGVRTLVNVRCGTTGLCEEAIPLLLSKIAEQVKIHVEAAYRGQQLKSVPTLDPPFEDKKRIQVPICNLADTMFGASGKGGEESTVNYLGQSCGATHCELRPQVRCSYCGRVGCNYRPTLMAGGIAEATTCEKERAWKRGAFLREVQVALAQVTEQVNRDKLLIVGPRCDLGMRDSEFQGGLAVVDKLFGSWVSANHGQPLRCDADPNQATPDEDPRKLFANDRRIPVIAGCSLNSAFTALTFSVAHAAVCEVFARAEEAWRGDRTRVDGVVKEVINLANAACMPAGAPSRIVDRTALIACVNREYSSRIVGEFRKVFSTLGAASPSAPNIAEGDSPIAVCPIDAPGCLKNCSDVLYCGEGTQFLSAQLRALAGVAQDLRAARANTEAAWPYFSKMPFYDPILTGGLDLPSCGASSTPFPGDIVAPVPSPVPSPQSIGASGVEVLSFPK